ncbi:hypothetical protein BYT27DRAFT_7206210 [Phlegmacium glaucopus]|nr:hypothetical protein BYT27DRAFT_7206210 [Phlegmacium glaucopus]
MLPADNDDYYDSNTTNGDFVTVANGLAHIIGDLTNGDKTVATANPKVTRDLHTDTSFLRSFAQPPAYDLILHYELVTIVPPTSATPKVVTGCIDRVDGCTDTPADHLTVMSQTYVALHSSKYRAEQGYFRTEVM